MAAKPIVLCKLRKGQLIDSQEHFVDTFNWMVDFINNLRGENGVTLSNPLTDRPVIRLDDEAEAAASDNDTSEVDVVVGSTYDAESHTLTQVKRRVTVLKAGDEQSPETVFVATPINL